MTVSSETNRASYNGAGNTGPFNIGFPIRDEAHLLVTTVVVATGVETELTLNAGTDGYTVNAALTQITTSEAVPVGERIVITRDVPSTQEIDYIANSPFPAETNEIGLDQLTMLVQQLEEVLSRTIKFQVTSQASEITIPDVTDNGTKFLRLNEAEDAFEFFNIADVSALSVSAFAETLLDDTTANAWLTTLGFSSFVQTLIDDVNAATFRTTIDSERIITNLTEINTLQDTDYFPFADASDSNLSKKISKANLALALQVSGLNSIINGNFNIWQRGTSFAGATNVTYYPDRFQYGKSGAVVHTVSRDTSVPNNQSDYSLKMEVTTADASIAAGDFSYIGYKVEGNDALKYAFGTADAKALTLSFWAKCAVTGVHCIQFVNSALNRSYVSEYTINSANTWEYKTVTLTADATGTWLTDSGVGLEIRWLNACGATFQTTAGSWQAGNFFASANQVNGNATIGNVFGLSQVKLELGATATAFSDLSFSQELERCQRYYEKSFNHAAAPAQNVGANSGELQFSSFVAGAAVNYAYQRFASRKRANPTMVTYNPAAANAEARNIVDGADCSGTTISVINDSSFRLNTTGNAANTVGDLLAVHWTAEAEL